MDKIFRVYTENGPNGEAELDLPAMDYELLDMAERLRLEPGQLPYLEILEFNDSFRYLEQCIQEQPDIYQLNRLAGRLFRINDIDVQAMAAFEGLVAMRMEKGELPVPIPSLIDFAYSPECCHVAEEADTNYTLGRFLAENGFCPEVESLSDEAFELLDFTQIGKTHRRDQGGVFTPFGYVEQHSEVNHVSRDMDFQPKKPDYAILLGMCKDRCDDPGCGNDKITFLKLPVSPDELDAGEAQGWSGAGWLCLDCRVPALAEMLSDARAGIDHLNHLAQRLADMEPKALTAYKALLEAAECKDLQSAELLMDALDQYIFSPQYASPVDVAMKHSSDVLREADREAITSHMNLYAYGEALIENCGGVLTPYGLIERVDGQPVQTMENKPGQGGMEMK